MTIIAVDALVQTDADNNNTQRPKLASGKNLHIMIYGEMVTRASSEEANTPEA